MDMETEFAEMLDCDVTIYVGPHVFVGSIGETENPELVVLHTAAGMSTIRASQITAYTLHPYKPD